MQIDILQAECECAQRCVDSVDIDTVNSDFWGTLYRVCRNIYYVWIPASVSTKYCWAVCGVMCGVRDN